MPDKLLVSVVIGAYNAGFLLEPTLKSILDSQGVEFELILVDDGSTDQTADLLDAFARDDERLRVFHQDNGGLTSALIRGCREARGKYIARQDIGDLSLPSRIYQQAVLLDANPNVVMATSGYRFVGPEDEILNEVLPRHTAAQWTGILRSGDEARLYCPHHGSVMFRKSAYDAVGGYRPEFYFAQDLDLWTRLAAVGDLDYVSEILYQARFIYDSISARYGAQQRQLRHIVAQATQRRVRGEPEDDLLQQATAIRKPIDGASRAVSWVVESDYFVGSCLAARKDPEARRYLRQVLRKSPLHIKAWAKLLFSYAEGARAFISLRAPS